MNIITNEKLNMDILFDNIISIINKSTEANLQKTDGRYSIGENIILDISLKKIIQSLIDTFNLLKLLLSTYQVIEFVGNLIDEDSTIIIKDNLNKLSMKVFKISPNESLELLIKITEKDSTIREVICKILNIGKSMYIIIKHYLKEHLTRKV